MVRKKSKSRDARYLGDFGMVSLLHVNKKMDYIEAPTRT